MNLTAQLITFRKQTEGLSRNERARLACELAKHMEKLGEYGSAAEALEEFWPDRNEAPITVGDDAFRRRESANVDRRRAGLRYCHRGCREYCDSGHSGDSDAASAGGMTAGHDHLHNEPIGSVFTRARTRGFRVSALVRSDAG